MIKIITDMATSDDLIGAIPDPKHVWRDIDRIIVATGDDMPPEPVLNDPL